MKNKTVSQLHHEVKVYEAYYKPSFNPIHFAKSILGVLVFGRTTVAPTYASMKRRSIK
ncbi:MAG: hypothetical protein JWP27_1383 [Flaviaesturariibacter sp.]|nr:hypothetical protein [Flaviaesturariibacter sp.]